MADLSQPCTRCGRLVVPLTDVPGATLVLVDDYESPTAAMCGKVGGHQVGTRCICTFEQFIPGPRRRCPAHPYDRIKLDLAGYQKEISDGPSD